jgi:hypothetical protein
MAAVEVDEETRRSSDAVLPEVVANAATAEGFR